MESFFREFSYLPVEAQLFIIGAVIIVFGVPLFFKKKGAI